MEYHKINTVFKRDPENKFRTLLEGLYALPEFELLRDVQWQWTEKVDGTNVRVYVDQDGLRITGKTDNATLHPDLVANIKAMFPRVGDLQNHFPAGVCFYGEGHGPKIQSGAKYSTVNTLVIFDILIDGLWMTRESIVEICEAWDLPYVPIIGEGTLPEMVDVVKQRLNSTWGGFPMEGIVARPKVELLTRRGERIITKLKCKDFGL